MGAARSQKRLATRRAKPVLAAKHRQTPRGVAGAEDRVAESLFWAVQGACGSPQSTNEVCLNCLPQMSGRGRGRGRGKRRRLGRGRGRGGSNYNRPSSGLLTQFYSALRRAPPEGPRLPARIPKKERDQEQLTQQQKPKEPSSFKAPYPEVPNIASRPSADDITVPGSVEEVRAKLQSRHGIPNPSLKLSTATPDRLSAVLREAGRARSFVDWRTSRQLDARGRRERLFRLEGSQLVWRCAWCLDPLNNAERVYCSTGCAHVSNVLLNKDYAAQCLIGREGDPSGALHCSECGSPEWLPPSMVSCTFQVDHIIGVAEGGGCCYLDNLRALCHACHEKKTTEDRDAF